MLVSAGLSIFLSLVTSASALPTGITNARSQVDDVARRSFPDVVAQFAPRAPQAPAACKVPQKRSYAGSIAKRIAQQDLPAVAQQWQDLCLASGGDTQTNDPCVDLAGVRGINALLANSDPCLQQDVADAMIDFAKSGTNNEKELVSFAKKYRAHPRNALALDGGLIPSTPFCQRAPKNSELNGIANAQLDGVNPGLFGGPSFPVVAFGDPASCPFGTTPNVDTCTCN